MINLSEFKSIFIGNWKLNGNIDFITEYYQKLVTISDNCVIICSPSIYLKHLNSNKHNLYKGAQDVSMYNEGAYTGELSAKMLLDCEINFCLVGHSERREFFGENDSKIKLKVENLIENKIIPVVCVGETLEAKEKKLTKAVIKKQIVDGIPEVSNYKNTIIAYEPIWAIGTGLTPTLEEIDEVHNFIKNINENFNNYNVLYGGSVKGSNSADINSLRNVDGCLVGGASLKVDEFNSIIS